MNPRIPPALTPYDEQTQAILNRLPSDWGEPFLVFRILARDPRLLQRYLSGSVAYLEPSHLTMRQREVFLLRVAALSRCEYEWELRVHFFAAAAGLADDQLAVICRPATDQGDWTGEELLLLRLAGELHSDCNISDGLWAEISTAFSPEAIMQLLLLAGSYRTMAYLANGLRIPREPMISGACRI
jgi:alkylhydroperoxidase family enzyme